MPLEIQILCTLFQNLELDFCNQASPAISTAYYSDEHPYTSSSGRTGMPFRSYGQPNGLEALGQKTAWRRGAFSDIIDGAKFLMKSAKNLGVEDSTHIVGEFSKDGVDYLRKKVSRPIDDIGGAVHTVFRDSGFPLSAMATSLTKQGVHAINDRIFNLTGNTIGESIKLSGKLYTQTLGNILGPLFAANNRNMGKK